ncbi:ABC transporter ATP-binding protein [Arthrobacter ginkgonis]|uniref:ABC transporter ATP-binding protein n=1 Tax=Arthrobacter ginkgonis TaxID=1630594 RepID=A0ABP7C3P7_9MICC
MLTTDSLTVPGRHALLLAPTSIAAAPGQLLLVVAEPQDTRTVLALALTARMKAGSGSVAWNGNSSPGAVRRASVLVDSPQINEPERHLRLADLVAEDLSLLPGPFWRRPRARAWLCRQGAERLARTWVDALDPADRLRLMLALALEDAAAELIVLDSPDRHGLEDGAWLGLLRAAAAHPRGPAVVAVVSRLPDGWDGPSATAGQHSATAGPDGPACGGDPATTALPDLMEAPA